MADKRQAETDRTDRERKERDARDAIQQVMDKRGLRRRERTSEGRKSKRTGASDNQEVEGESNQCAVPATRSRISMFPD